MLEPPSSHARSRRLLPFCRFRTAAAPYRFHYTMVWSCRLPAAALPFAACGYRALTGSLLHRAVHAPIFCVQFRFTRLLLSCRSPTRRRTRLLCSCATCGLYYCDILMPFCRIPCIRTLFITFPGLLGPPATWISTHRRFSCVHSCLRSVAPPACACYDYRFRFYLRLVLLGLRVDGLPFTPAYTYRSIYPPLPFLFFSTIPLGLLYHFTLISTTSILPILLLRSPCTPSLGFHAITSWVLLESAT